MAAPASRRLCVLALALLAHTVISARSLRTAGEDASLLATAASLHGGSSSSLGNTDAASLRGVAAPSFRVANDQFEKDGEAFVLRSGSIH